MVNVSVPSLYPSHAASNESYDSLGKRQIDSKFPFRCGVLRVGEGESPKQACVSYLTQGPWVEEGEAEWVEASSSVSVLGGAPRDTTLAGKVFIGRHALCCTDGKNGARMSTLQCPWEWCYSSCSSWSQQSHYRYLLRREDQQLPLSTTRGSLSPQLHTLHRS